MPPSRDAEDSVYQTIVNALKGWLSSARDKVMAPWRMFRAQPSPTEIQSTTPEWRAAVERIASSLTPAIREGWGAIDLPPTVDLADPYIQANLAMTKNLIVRVPDEVYAMVVNAIMEGANAQESPEEIATRVQNILDFTGSEDWAGRARTIAQTETNRHYNSGMLAHGFRLERGGRRGLSKVWHTRMDGRERPWHGEANNDEKELSQPFIVGGEPLLFPCDPSGQPWNVINCRCSLQVLWRI